ncbi:MAG: histidine phosphatase family protein [Hamadaea sp.]|uniref:histidine phosphatase family protein n=1 Tax=Hamadaea sp. TaxID=2024425 RepID=UPI00180EDAE6|nr:histidine phosphatase family protein [Hamadaea sp.]NUT22803.1 histidine phosphatase family protein [Hamadaea sp.]
MTSAEGLIAGTRVILWRHGNTDWNAEHRVQGQTDVPLNDLGREQAAQAAARLVSLKPDLLVSSDLQRAARTADALAELTGLRPERDARLRERYFGAWETFTTPEIKERFPESRVRWESGDPDPGDGIEPLPDLAKRVGEVIRETAERIPGGLSVLATHGGSIKYGVAAFLGLPDDFLPTLGSIGNCHWVELRVEAKSRWRLHAYNVN